jgi:hypothetical protein
MKEKINRAGIIIMEPIELTPKYTSLDVSGKCLRCLAAKEANDCLYNFLDGEVADEDLLQRFKLLAAFYNSQDLQKLIDQSEKYLSDGKMVSVKLMDINGKLSYELIVK